jgi:hypothetical protein
MLRHYLCVAFGSIGYWDRYVPDGLSGWVYVIVGAVGIGVPLAFELGIALVAQRVFPAAEFSKAGESTTRQRVQKVFGYS